MNNNGRVCVATIAFNDPSELAALLESLLSLSRLPDGLVVVDNSTDRLLMPANRSVFERYAAAIPWSRYHANEVNTGAAGGFRLGMEMAHREGFDWVWLLDQDGTVAPDSLAELLAYGNYADILCPRMLSIEDGRTDVVFSARINFWGRILYMRMNENRPTRVSVICTHGMLVGRHALDVAGYYDDERFFFRAEDLEYGYRAKALGLTMAQIPRAVAYHPEHVAPSIEAVLPKGLGQRIFYHFRNIFPLFLKWDWKDETELERLHHRQYTALIRKHVRGFKFRAACLFSLTVLFFLKMAGRDIDIARAREEYGKLAE